MSTIRAAHAGSVLRQRGLSTASFDIGNATVTPAANLIAEQAKPSGAPESRDVAFGNDPRARLRSFQTGAISDVSLRSTTMTQYSSWEPG